MQLINESGRIASLFIASSTANKFYREKIVRLFFQKKRKY